MGDICNIINNKKYFLIRETKQNYNVWIVGVRRSPLYWNAFLTSFFPLPTAPTLLHWSVFLSPYPQHMQLLVSTQGPAWYPGMPLAENQLYYDYFFMCPLPTILKPHDRGLGNFFSFPSLTPRSGGEYGRDSEIVHWTNEGLNPVGSQMHLCYILLLGITIDDGSEH